MFEAGTLLAGKYRVDRVLGRGGMGVVVAATHVYLGQRVALKFLLPEFLHDQTTVERFVREARAAAALRGEHVCRVSDVGTLETGSPYIVMELLDGSDLATILANQGRLSSELASQYLLQACVGLAEAHGLGIVHRDLKPANLFVTRRPDGSPLVKVLDFGIAKAQHDAAFHLTQTATVMGSPGYMSPEQLRSSRGADVRSDIWALGVILYELVSGRPPFVAESITELALRVAMDPLPPLVVAVTTGFDQVVTQCLEKDPARRFQDVAALAHALAPFAGAGGRELALGTARVLHVAAPAAPTHIAAAPGAPTTLSSSAGSATGTRRSVPWAMIAGAAAAAVIGIVAIALWRGGGAGHAASAPAADPPAPPAAAVVEPAAPAAPVAAPAPAAPSPAATPAAAPSAIAAPAPAAGPTAAAVVAPAPPAAAAPAPVAVPATAAPSPAATAAAVPPAPTATSPRAPAAAASSTPRATVSAPAATGSAAPVHDHAAPSAPSAAPAASVAPAAPAAPAAGPGSPHKPKPRPRPASPPPATPPEDVGASRF